MEQRVVHAVIGDVDPGRVGAEHPHELVPGGLGRDQQPGRPPDRGADRRLVEGGADRGVRVRLGEERQIVDRDHHRHAGAERHRVVRHVQDVRADLLGHQRQPGLLPGQPGGPVGDRGRAGHDAGVGHQPPVPLLVVPLAGHGEVGPRLAEGDHQAVHVAAQAPRGPRAPRSRQLALEAPRPVSLLSRAPGPGTRIPALTSIPGGSPHHRAYAFHRGPRAPAARPGAAGSRRRTRPCRTWAGPLRGR